MRQGRLGIHRSVLMDFELQLHIKGMQSSWLVKDGKFESVLVLFIIFSNWTKK